MCLEKEIKTQKAMKTPTPKAASAPDTVNGVDPIQMLNTIEKELLSPKSYKKLPLTFRLSYRVTMWLLRVVSFLQRVTSKNSSDQKEGLQSDDSHLSSRPPL